MLPLWYDSENGEVFPELGKAVQKEIEVLQETRSERSQENSSDKRTVMSTC
jgi:hypothetical protein